MMLVSWPVVLGCLALAGACQLSGCGNTASVFDLKTEILGRIRKNAEFYTQEATRLRQMAQNYDHRVLVYERLFGPHSDWVEGTRFLAQSYAAAAQEQQRIAARHQRLYDSRVQAAYQESR